MKSTALIALLAATLVSAQQPGQCKATPDCAKFGDGYTCVAVQSAIAGITLASQCVIGTTCGGNTPGKCPTFSSWSSKFQKIQPVCAFTNVTNCVNPIKDGTTAASTSGSTNVNCYQATFTVNNDSQIVNGIYKCVDSGLYVSQNLGAITNLTTTQMDACAGNTSTSGGALCNGHGTCAPTIPFSSKYQCLCNEGYSSSDNCDVATSNVCDSFGSCGSGNSCDQTSKQCSCTSGTKGPQCSQCDSTAPATDQCSGNGVCNTEGVCTCNSGYTGSLCAKTAADTAGSTTGETNKSGAGTQTTLSLAAALVVVFASAL